MPDTEKRIGKCYRLRLALRRFHVEGFKSLRDVVLELGGRNPIVLVGANGAGKSNIIELLLFLRRALHDELRRRPYAPHTEWGNPRNLTWEASGAPIRVELEYLLSIGDREGCKLSGLQERLTYTVVFAPDQAFTVLYPAYERLELPGFGYVIERAGKRLEVRLKSDGSREKLEQQLEKCCGDSKVECDERWCRVVYTLDAREDGVPPVLAVPGIVLGPHSNGEGLSSDLVILADCCPVRVPFPSNKFGLRVGMVLGLLGEWFSKIVVLRQVDYGVAKWPHMRYNDMSLRPRAENLAEILYRVMEEPGEWERVQAAMATLFPWLEVRVEFNEYGHIGLVFYEKRGEKTIRLYPSMVPDGVIKLLAIIAAISIRPSLLAVDEFENSLHASLIDYLIRELEDMENPAILATHSPVVVDLAGPERTFLLRRSPDGDTVVDKLARKELWEKMKEEGLTLSDYYLYAST